jgi:hypothetical protein
MASINAFYDLRVAPLTFDFLTYLQILQVHLIRSGTATADLCLIASEYRRASWIEKSYAQDSGYEDRKLLNCILTVAALSPFVRDVLLHRGGYRLATNNHSYPLGFDPETVQGHSPIAMLPCTNGALARAWSEAGRPKLGNVVRPTARAERLASETAGSKYVTLSLRTTPHNHSRNTPLPLFYELYSRLSLAFPDIRFIVIPDQDDYFFAKTAWQYPWELDLGACFDFDLRVAFYKNAVLNIGWTGGITSVLWYSDFPYVYFGQWNESNPISSRDFFNRKGPAIGDQLPWSISGTQWLDWTEASELTSDFCYEKCRSSINNALGRR